MMRAEACKKLSEERGISMTQIVLGFFLVQPFQCVALYGPKDADQIIEAMKATENGLTKEEYKRISNIGKLHTEAER